MEAACVLPCSRCLLMDSECVLQRTDSVLMRSESVLPRTDSLLTGSEYVLAGTDSLLLDAYAGSSSNQAMSKTPVEIRRIPSSPSLKN